MSRARVASSSTLVGKVKITVIATGFAHVGRAAAATLPTPTDMSIWEAEARRIAAAKAPASAPAPAVAEPAQVAVPAMAQRTASVQATVLSPQLHMERRPAIEMALPLVTPDPDADALRLEDIDLSLDVPAFLRQK